MGLGFPIKVVLLCKFYSWLGKFVPSTRLKVQHDQLPREIKHPRTLLCPNKITANTRVKNKTNYQPNSINA